MEAWGELIFISFGVKRTVRIIKGIYLVSWQLTGLMYFQANLHENDHNAYILKTEPFFHDYGCFNEYKMPR